MGLDLIEFAMAIEEEFDIEIPDSDAEAMRTLGDVQAYVQSHLGRRIVDPAESWRRIRERAADQFGVSAEELTPETVLLQLAPDG